MATENTIKALAIVCELTGTELSKAALHVMASDLAEYPEPQVLGALQRCRRELRGRLTLADVIARLEDGRPGPEEAWAMIPHSEDATVIWTTECMHAHSVAAPLLAQGDKVAARMAFLECYRKLTADARATHMPTKWHISLGWDVPGRTAPLVEAIAKGRLTQNEAARFLPPPEPPTLKLLEGSHHISEAAAEALAGLRLALRAPTEIAKPISESQEAARG